MKSKITFYGFFAVVIFLSHSAWAGDSYTDHMARVYVTEGSVKILKSRGAKWEDVTSGTLLEAGDQIETGSQSFMFLSYDDDFSNLVRLDENTYVEWKGIEPGQVVLKNGEIFHTIDRPDQRAYQIETPLGSVKVLGSRVTVHYDPAAEIMIVTAVPDQKEAVQYFEIFPSPNSKQQAPVITIEEGEQFDLEREVASEPKRADPGRILEAMENLYAMKQAIFYLPGHSHDPSGPDSEGRGMSSPGQTPTSS